MTTETAQTTHDVRHVTTEDTTIRVELVDDDVAEILEEHGPLRVMRQDPRMQHVGVGQDQVGARPHGPPRVLRRIPIVGEHAELGQGLGDRFELGELILGERLGRKEIEHARVGLPEQRLQHGQVVAERLSRRRRRHDDDVLALLDQGPCLGLV